jgi:hypothetical protein
MLAFVFWFMVSCVFITAFGDIFRRDDLSGWGRPGISFSEISGGGLRWPSSSVPRKT